MGTIDIFNLNEFVEKYNIKNFIETGTLHGNGVQFAMRYDFESIHSIEIIEELSIKAKLKFSKEPRVTIHQGNSSDILKILLPTLEGNNLYWLDAHFPGMDSRHNKSFRDFPVEVEAPLKNELKSIEERIHKYNDVIIMDDLWVYEDCPCESGLFNDHVKKQGWNITRQELVSDGLEFIENSFLNTHDMKKDYRHQGYIILTPKEDNVK